LVVEDNEVDAELLRHALLEFGYEPTIARDGREAFDCVRTGQFRLVISDWEMPEMNGLELCREIRKKSLSYIYIVLVTTHTGINSVVQGLNAGADDFLSKPFDPQELCVRLRAGVRILSLESREVTIFALARLAESRDPETGEHLERMREYCRILADYLSHQEAYRNQIDGEYVQLIFSTSPLHDIGKVGIPDHVLLKPGSLTKEEFEIMKQHAIIGAETLDAALNAYPDARYLQMARDIAWTHHEKFDGSGYPRGLAGEDIPLCGRIVAVADVYDALTTRRVYKEPYSHDVARSIIIDGRGKHFDPAIVDGFLQREADFLAVKERFTSDEFDGDSAFFEDEQVLTSP
jgi:putative two-component system response regulator